MLTVLRQSHSTILMMKLQLKEKQTLQVLTLMKVQELELVEDKVAMEMEETQSTPDFAGSSAAASSLYSAYAAPSGYGASTGYSNPEQSFGGVQPGGSNYRQGRTGRKLRKQQQG